MNRTMVEMIKSMLHHAGAPMELWGEAAITASYILQRVLTTGDTLRTPKEVYGLM